MKTKKILAATMLTLLMAGCQKDEFDRIPEGAVRLTAEKFQGHGTKTAVSDKSVMWMTGDTIRFDDTDTTYVTAPVTVADGQAYVDGVPDVSPIYAYCPMTLGVSTFRSDDAVITMPSVYPSRFDGEGRQVINLPMVAKVNAQDVSEIMFRHISAAVKVTVKNLNGTALALDSVVVSSNTLQLCGTRHVTIGVGSVAVAAQEQGLPSAADRRVKVTFSGSPAIASTDTREVQVPFWPVAATTGEGDFTINVYAHDGTNKKYVYCKNGTSPAIDRNQLLTANISMGDNVVDLDGASGEIVVTDGKILTGTHRSTIKVSIAAGATVTLDNVTIEGTDHVDDTWAGLTCLGNATLVLSGVNYLTSSSSGYPGIYVPAGSTLTIKGNGTLTASGRGQGGAGIGGGYNLSNHTSINCGNIVIQSGTINAKGVDFAAGIGSGAQSSCGTITIQGGNVTAKGGGAGAGIGSGFGINGSRSSCGVISITGGNVNATGGVQGVGIGSGDLCGDINISGGNVMAAGGNVSGHDNLGSAGIGAGGYSYNTQVQSFECGNITISGGTVVAIGRGYSAGIGTSSLENTQCGNITITTGVTSLTATKGSNTALNNIGRGHASSTCDTVTVGIKVYWDGTSYQNDGNSQLTTESYVYSPRTINLGELTGNYTAQDGDILTGTVNGSYLVTIPHNTTVVLDNVTIDHSNHSDLPGLFCNGTIILVGTNTVKGSGGNAGVLVQSNGHLTIKGTGTLNAHGGHSSAGIGGQFHTVFGNITIESGSVNAYGGYSGVGIGAAPAGSGGNITITGGNVYAVGGEGWTCGIGCSGKPHGLAASQVDDIYISGGTVTAIGDMAAGISNGYFEGFVHRTGNIYLVGDCNVYAEGTVDAIANWREVTGLGRSITISTSGCVYARRVNDDNNDHSDKDMSYETKPICIYGFSGTSYPFMSLQNFNTDDDFLWYKNGPNCPWDNNGK